ncbi:MAG: hypothetical protein PVH12_02130 [Candidatus Bathyarchaeota archaeon]
MKVDTDDTNERISILVIILATVIVVTLLSSIWAVARIRALDPRIARVLLGDLRMFYIIRTVISSVNITLLIFLSLMYIDIYRTTRSEFTFGLMLFSGALLLYALSSNPIVHWIFGYRAFGLGPFAMLPDLFTCMAVGILLYITVK